jgi:hypothetical protein
MKATRKNVIESFSATGFAIVFLGYSMTYLLRFNPFAVIELPFGFSHFALFSLAVLGFPSAIIYFRKLISIEIMFISWIFFAITYSSAAIALGFPSHSIVQQSLGYMQAIALWWIFRDTNTRSRTIRTISSLVLVVCGVAVWNAPVEVTIDNAHLFSYHTSALVIFVSGFVLSATGHKASKITFCSLAIYCLYLNGARTEFVVFFAIAPILVFGRLDLQTVFLWVLLVLISSVVVLFFKDSLLGVESASRITGLLDISSDLSGVARGQTMFNGAQSIVESPFWGNYASYVPGFYSHNLLSAWVDFGILGFIFYVVLVSLLAKSAYNLHHLNENGSASVLAVVLAFIVAVLLSKAYFHPMIGVVVGIVSAAYKSRNEGIAIESNVYS